MFGLFVVNGWGAGGFALLAIAVVVVVAHLTLATGVPRTGGDPVAQRRRGIKALVIGVDGRASTSRLQAVLWTFAVLFAYLFLLFWGRSTGCPDPEHTKRCEPAATASGALSRALSGELQTEYYVLLGFPIGTALAASALTKNKVASGDLVKTPIEGAPQGAAGVRQGLAEVVSSDDGKADLIDFQYLAFNLLALTYFAVQFGTHPSAGLPDIPPTLLALSGVSTATYAAKKALESDIKPAITRVIPQRVRRAAGSQLTVVGVGFGERGGPAELLIEGVPASVQSWEAAQIKVELTTELLAALPAEPSVEVTVLDAEGRASEAVPIELYGAGSERQAAAKRPAAVKKAAGR